MYVKLALTLTVLCAVISKTESEKSYDGRSYMQGYTRIKRGKYNPGPQKIFYNRPPVSFPVKGIFSYTPPPNYMHNDDEPQYPGPPGPYSRPPKVSKRPYYDDDSEKYPGPPGSHFKPSKSVEKPADGGLGDDDINNIVKYLSKQDLDKLINLAGGGDRDSNRYKKESFDADVENPRTNEDAFKSTDNGFSDLNSYKYSVNSIGDDDNKLFKAFVQEIETEPNTDGTLIQKQQFSVASNNIPSIPGNFVTQATPPEFYTTSPQNSKLYDTSALEAEESMLKKQIAYLKSQINDGVVYTDSSSMPEESLPKPLNLREEQDFDVSYTNNVPTVVRADKSNSYKLENFGDLPLMSNSYKLESLSSYHVPHYTVTSSSSISKPSSSYSAPSSSYSAPSPHNPGVPSVEPAPPPSAAKEQSDAHLKAVRIWSHRSKGTAYTLHDDGTLSLERPGRPKGSYGYP